jgi:hypothetical protein
MPHPSQPANLWSAGPPSLKLSSLDIFLTKWLSSVFERQSMIIHLRPLGSSALQMYPTQRNFPQDASYISANVHGVMYGEFVRNGSLLNEERKDGVGNVRAGETTKGSVVGEGLSWNN